MHQILRAMRSLLYPAAAFFLLWAGYQVLADTYISDASGRILVVYRAEAVAPALPSDCTKLTLDMENPSEQGLLGVCQAFADQKGHHPRPAIELLNLNESADSSGNLNSGKAYEQLSARLAKGSILGAISLLTSPDSQPVVRLCRSMQIPLLLAIAANNDLLAPAEDAGGIAFRMTPTNGQQALDISDWLRTVAAADQGVRRVAVFHEPNTFGEYLFRQINSNMKADTKLIFYQFEVREQMEFADIMPQLWCNQIDAVLYLGFAPRAMDLINKLNWYRADPDTTNCRQAAVLHRKTGPHSRTFEGIKVLLSSAAYQSDLNDSAKFLFPFDAYAMLPVKPSQEDGKETSFTSQYGYDAYTLMARLASGGKGKGPGALNAILSDEVLKSKTGHRYQFDDHGELVPVASNKYQLCLLASSLNAKEPCWRKP